MNWFSHGYHGYRYCSWARTHDDDDDDATGRPSHMKTWFTVYFFDIGHSCYDQLTPVKTRYLLTSITWPYRGLNSTTHRGHVFFQVDRWLSAAFLIGSRAHVRLACWKQDRIERKPVNASPGLRFTRIITDKILPFPIWVNLIGHWSYAFGLA